MCRSCRKIPHGLYLVRFLYCPEIQASLQFSCTRFPCLSSAQVPGFPRQTFFTSVCITPGTLFFSLACSISMADKVGFRFSERLCLKGIHGRTTRQDIQQPSLASVHTGMRRHKHKGIPRGLTFKVFVFYLTEYTSVHAHHTDTPTHKYRIHTHTYLHINE